MKQLNDFFFNDLGTVQTVPKFKCATGSAIAALGLAAVGTVASISMTNDINDSNKELYRESQDFQEKMLLEQERYNSPQNQRAMLQEAGYSPYAYLNGASSSVGLGSSPSVPSMQFPDMSGFDKMASMLFDMESMRANVDKTKSETSGIDISNRMNLAKAQFAEDNALWEMVQNRNMAEISGYQKESAFWNQKLDAYSFQDKVRNFSLTNDLLRENINKTAMDSSLTTLNVMEAQKRFEYLPRILDNELKLQLARIDTEYSTQHLNQGRYLEAVQGALLSASQRNKTNLDAVGVELNNQRLRDTARFYVREQEQNALLAKWRTLSEKNNAQNTYNYYNDVHYKPTSGYGKANKYLEGFFDKATKWMPSIGIFKGLGR